LNLKFCKTEQELLYIGNVTKEYSYRIQWNDANRILESTIGYLISQWEDSSYKCDLMQSKNADGVFREYDSLYNPNTVTWRSPTNPQKELNTDSTSQQPIKVGIIREEGSNGDREMAAAFFMAGFECVDISMYDLQQNPKLLRELNGIAFVGGFSYSDCLGAGQGWCSVIQNNSDVYAAFEEFRTRPDTFSLGVCNGCQMLSLLGWVGDCKFVQNESGKFESRFPTVKICESPAIMFKGLSGAVLGVWCAHGEGKLQITNGVLPSIIPALQFVNADCEPTVAYPNNPNGSVMGITAVCSSDGRHLAMMPHPERSFIKWQLPWEADSFRGDKITRGVDSVSDSTKTLWFDMFVNARKWVESQK
jgi:phosphoribosylformylglycinamidine synthase